MKKHVIGIVIIIAVMLLAGCALQQTVNDDAQQPTEKKVNPDNLPPESKVDRYKVPPDEPAEEPDREPEQAIVMEEKRTTTTTTGSSATFTKIQMNEREKGASEKCDMDYPISCSGYFANDGIIYLSLKNGYGSKINDVTLTFKGDSCDPTGTTMQPGELKEFECYADSGVDVASGELEMEYYNVIEQRHVIKTGDLVVLVE